MAAISGELQQAIALARAGKVGQAREHAEQVLASEPDNTHALFLMSSLSESQESQADYLQRILEIDPDYREAQERLAQLDVSASESVEEELLTDEDELPDTMIMEAPLYEKSDDAEPPSPTAVADHADEEGHGALFARTSSTDEAEGAEIDFDDMAVDEPETSEQALAEAESAPLSLIEQSEAESVPDWLREAGGFKQGTTTPEAEWSPEEMAAQEELDHIPDWLQDEPDADWLDQTLVDKDDSWSEPTYEEPPDEVVAATPAGETVRQEPEDAYEPPATEGLDLEAELTTAGAAGEAAPTPSEQRRPGSSTRTYEIILGILIVLALAVVAALAYVIIVLPF